MSKANSGLVARLRELLPYFGGTGWAFVAAAIGAAVGAATETTLAWMMKPLLDRGFASDGFPLWAVPVAIIGLFLVRGIAGFVVNYALAWAAQAGTLSMRSVMFERVLKCTPALMTQQTSSSLINTVVYELQLGTTMLVNAVQTLLKDGFTVFALMGYLLWINWQLTLFIAVLFPAVAWVMKIFGKRMHQVTVAGQVAADELAYVVEENVLAWRLVRLHNAATRQLARFMDASRLLRGLSLKATVASSVVTPITQMLSACALSAVIVVALWQSREQGGTVGAFVSYVTAMLALITPLKHLSEVAGPVTRGLVAIERGLDLISQTPPETQGSYIPESVRSSGSVCIKNLSVCYPKSSDFAIKGINLEVNANATIALVGSSGSGKTTLVNALARFVDISGGEILLDGIDIRQWNLDALRQQMVFVSQDVVMLNDSICNNVALGATPDRERVIHALTAANLIDHINTMPLGIDTMAGHNACELSGGQRQRLGIARAIYKNAPILILDEATSALDTESEQAVKLALQSLKKDRTTIIIAHRLSTIAHADTIVVMGHGKIIETGTHAQLMALQGAYAKLQALGASNGDYESI